MLLSNAAFAWIKCEKEEDKDCHATLSAAKIIGRAGHVFGVDNTYVRLSLVNSQDDFELLQHRLEMLVFQEKLVTIMTQITHGGDITRKSNLSVPMNATYVSDEDVGYYFNQELASEENRSLYMLDT